MKEKKLNVLISLKTLFNEKSILWGIGGSFLLNKKYLVDVYNDLDIVVYKENYFDAYSILKSIGKQVIVQNEEPYYSKYYSSFIVDGIEVDLISDFCIKYEDNYYVYDFSIRSIKMDNGIPLCRLEDWVLLYKYMGRESKVKLIERLKLDKRYKPSIKVLDIV